MVEDVVSASTVSLGASILRKPSREPLGGDVVVPVEIERSLKSHDSIILVLN